MRRRVLLTGAAGTIAGLLLPTLRERYDLRLIDVRGKNREGVAVEGIEITDLLDLNRDQYRNCFSGVDAVVHCAFLGTADTNQKFTSELRNIQMAYNVYQTAWEERVRRVVVASSNHAADYYERLILDGEWDVVTPQMKALSDNYYGWAKDAYEHLGFVFAVGRVSGRPLENVQIRIGGPRETDVSRCEPGNLPCVRRALGVYISQRDLAQLFVRSIEAKDISNERGVPFQIFYGISANSHAFWSIVNARRVIGYAPQDNSEIRFAQQIADHIRAVQDSPM